MSRLGLPIKKVILVRIPRMYYFSYNMAEYLEILKFGNSMGARSGGGGCSWGLRLYKIAPRGGGAG